MIHANRKLTGVLKGRVLDSCETVSDGIVLRFTDHSAMHVKTGAPMAESTVMSFHNAAISNVRQQGSTAMLLPQQSAHSFPERSVQRQSAPVRAITDKPTPEFNAIAGTCIVLVQRLHDPDDGIDSWKSITICAAWMDWRVKAPQSGCLPDENDSCVSRVRINPQKTALFPRCERLAARAGRA